MCIATLIAASILIAIFFTNLNLFDLGLNEVLRMENDKVDEIATAALLIVIGLGIDLVRARRVARRHAEINEQRLCVLQATMRTMHDLVSNFLNNMQLFRMEAEDGALSVESLELFDELIYGTAAKLKALGNSESVVEYEMASGVGILALDRS